MFPKGVQVSRVPQYVFEKALGPKAPPPPTHANEKALFVPQGPPQANEKALDPKAPPHANEKALDPKALTHANERE